MEYEGDWKDGKRTGRGGDTWGPDSKWAGDRYDSDIEDGKFHGRGIYVFADGSRY